MVFRALCAWNVKRHAVRRAFFVCCGLFGCFFGERTTFFGGGVGQDDPSCRFGERTAFLRSVSVGRAAHGPPYNDEKRVSGYAAAMQWSDRGFLRRITKGEDKTSPFLCNYCSPYA